MAPKTPKNSSLYQPKQPPAPKPPSLLADMRRGGPYNVGVVRKPQQDEGALKRRDP
jgi:hypothetical protein